MNPVFWGTDWRALADINPNEITVLEYKPKPGAKGRDLSEGKGLGEWRIVGGDNVEFVSYFDWYSTFDYEKELLGE